MPPVIPLGHEPVESPSALSSRPKGLQVERLKSEWRFKVIHERDFTLISKSLNRIFHFKKEHFKHLTTCL